MRPLALAASILLLTALCSAGGPQECHQRYRFRGKVYFCQRPLLHKYPHWSRNGRIIVTWGRKTEKW